MTASLGVAAAFELSWQALDESAQQVAAVLSLFALVEIPWTLVEQCLPEVDAEELEEIRDRALLGANLLKRVDQGMYQLHQLLREFFAAKRSQRANDSALQQRFYEVVIAEAKRVQEKPERSLIKESTVAIAHLQVAMERLTRPEQALEAATCLFWLASLYHDQGRYVEAEPLYLRSLSIREQQLGQDHLDVVLNLGTLAKLLRVQGRYPEAEPLCLRALAIRERKLGADAPDVAASLNDLAGLRSSQKRYPEAETLYLQALAISEQQLEADDPFVATSLNNLAGLYQLQGRSDEAESLYNRALNISERLYGEKSFEVAEILHNLATLYYSQEQYSKAEPLLLFSLPIHERWLGETHPAVAITINSLANLYQLQGRYVEAEPLYVQALEILLNRLDNDHRHTQTVQQSFRLLLQKVMWARQAEQLSDHPVTQKLLRRIQAGDTNA
jgi:tetratricopeptide (TPR) repeat protein